MKPSKTWWNPRKGEQRPGRSFDRSVSFRSRWTATAFRRPSAEHQSLIHSLASPSHHHLQIFGVDPGRRRPRPNPMKYWWCNTPALLIPTGLEHRGKAEEKKTGPKKPIARRRRNAGSESQRERERETEEDRKEIVHWNGHNFIGAEPSRLWYRRRPPPRRRRSFFPFFRLFRFPTGPMQIDRQSNDASSKAQPDAGRADRQILRHGRTWLKDGRSHQPIPSVSFASLAFPCLSMRVFFPENFWRFLLIFTQVDSSCHILLVFVVSLFE